MKTIAQTLLAALLLTAPTLATNANAAALNRADEPTTTNHVVTTTNAFRVAVYKAAKPMTINVFVEKQTPKPVLVRLVNQSGDLLSEQTIGRQQGKFQYRFDLSELADGTYSVEVSSGTDKSGYPITVTTPTNDRTLKIQ